jgi:hypothetical protein
MDEAGVIAGEVGDGRGELAVALPIPLVEPVTSAVLPFRSVISSILSIAAGRGLAG